MSKSSKFCLELKNLSRTFMTPEGEVSVLRDINLTLSAGDTLAICGPSGAGKSTLLNLIGGLDEPSSGCVLVDGRSLHELDDRERAQMRNHFFGFIFQFHHLLRDFNVLENVTLPLLIQGHGATQSRKRAQEMLERVGIVDKGERGVMELSGGEQQRVAIARALVTRPQLILADEPTGNLDERNGRAVFDLLCEINRDLGSTLVVVTHHVGFAQKMSQILRLERGELTATQATQTP